jgi:hypothetical protein
MVGTNGAAKPARNRTAWRAKTGTPLEVCAGLSKKQPKDARILALEMIKQYRV